MPDNTPQFSFRRLVFLAALLAFLAAWLIYPAPSRKTEAQTIPSDFKNFEGPQVHPLSMTPDGTHLLAVNTPNASLSVFHVTGDALTLMAEIPVGLEPVSVAARNNNEAWVTNWLSDSVSIVDLNSGNVVRTLDVGDEPTDLIFAGAQSQSAFVCVAGPNQVK